MPIPHHERQNYRIGFIGGGSGGHVFPAIAVMRRFEEACRRDAIEVDCFWLLGKNDVDRSIAGENHLRAHFISAGKLRRYFSLQNLLDLFKLLWSILLSLRILKQERPDIVFSKGGFVSVGPVIAAAILRIPIYMHDSDLDPGLATRLTARFAKRIFIPYAESIPYYRKSLRDKLSVSGNPVRREILIGDSKAFRDRNQLPQETPILVVLGGSQGSAFLNAFVMEYVDRLVEQCVIVHQLGSAHYARLQPEHEQYHGRYFPYSFLHDELPDVLASADLILTRAGAGAIWEAALTDTPMILVPMGLSGSRGDQLRNAELFSSHGGALMLQEENDATESLFGAIIRLLRNEEARRVLSASARDLCSQNADIYIAERILEDIRGCNAQGGSSCPSKYSTSSHS